MWQLQMKEAVNAFEYLSKTEGIIPAIESSTSHCICNEVCANFGQR